MKNEFNQAAAISREAETILLSKQLTQTQRSDYDALLQGQEVTHASIEQRIALDRERLVQGEFNSLFAGITAPKLDQEGGVLNYEKAVRDAKDTAEKRVDAHEARRRGACDELTADARWRFVKAAEKERTGKGDDEIDPKGR